MTMTIIAFDPGGTTGWATFSQDTMSINNEQRWSRGQIGPHEHHEELDQLLGLQHVNDYTVVYESFEYRNRSRPGLVLDSVEYIGVIKRWCQANKQTGRVRLYKQTAAMAKGFVKDENIKKLDLWFPGNPHAMDATRHLLYYIIHGMHGDSALALDLLQRGWK